MKIPNTVELNDLIAWASDRIPRGWDIRLCINSQEAYLALEDPDGDDVDVCTDDLNTVESIVRMVNHAREAVELKPATFPGDGDVADAPASGDPTLPDRQRQILMHSLGLNLKDRPYRNRYVTGPGCDSYGEVQALVAAGLMVQGGICNLANLLTGSGETHYYHLTPAGCAAVGQQYDPEW